MVRRIIVFVALAAIAGLNYGAAIADKIEFLWRVPEGETAAMNLLVDADVWLLNHGIEPILAALFLAVFLSGWVIPDGWTFFKRRFFSRGATTFNEQFRDIRFADARMDFRLGMEKAFTKYRRDQGVERGFGSLVALIDGVQFPERFPPPDDRPLSKYLTTALWRSDVESLTTFLRELYLEVPEAEKSTMLPSLEYQRLLRGYNVTAKFWDNEAREIIEGRLSAKTVARQIESNARDILLLAMSSLVLAEIIPWDKGSGHRSLFLLALHKSALRREWPWRRY